MNRFSLPLAVLFCAAVAASPARAADGCIGDWSVAAKIVQQKNLVTVEDITQRMRAANGGSVVKTVLCESGGSYVYRLTVKDAKGALKTMTVDARSGR